MPKVSDKQPIWASLVDGFRLSLWVLIRTAIFLPMERLFALHPQRIFRQAIAAALGYDFLGSLLPDRATPVAAQT